MGAKTGGAAMERALKADHRADQQGACYASDDYQIVVVHVSAYLQVYLTPVASSILRSTAQSFLYSTEMNLASRLNSAARPEPSQGKLKNASLIFSASFG